MIPVKAGAFSAAAVLLSPVCAAAAQDTLITPTYSFEDARNGAQLRGVAATIIPILMWPCPTSPAFDVPAARYQALKASLVLDRQKMDLAIVEADHEYHMSLVDIACPDPEAPETLEREKLNISIVNGALDRIERLVVRDRKTNPEEGQ